MEHIMKSCDDKDKYADTGLSPNMEDYMETIIILSTLHRVVRVKDIAKELNIKMPSVTAALNKLKEMKLIDYEKYGFIELTESGKEIAERVYNRHSCIKDFFEYALQLPTDAAGDEACKVEHHISPTTCKRIFKLHQFILQEEESGKEWVTRMKNFMRE
jgi:DtxR family Mn-dependent transcriptional regulator